MNAFGFFVRRIAAQFGFRGERSLWGAVNRETQILGEAEDLLGRLAWTDVRDIDELSGEYWQILDLDRQQQELRQASREADERNQQLREKLYAIEDAFDEKLTSLRQRKAQRMEQALELMREIDQLKRWKDQAKKKFQNLQVKLDLMRRHGQDPSQISAEAVKTKEAMERLKEQFTSDLNEINEKSAQIEECEKEIAEIDAEMAKLRVQVREETAELNQEIGRLSKQIAEYSAKIGALENVKAEYYAQLGHFLSTNMDSRDPAIVAVLRKHRPLLSRIAYYQRSIAYNRQLVSRNA